MTVDPHDDRPRWTVEQLTDAERTASTTTQGDGWEEGKGGVLDPVQKVPKPFHPSSGTNSGEGQNGASAVPKPGFGTSGELWEVPLPLGRHRGLPPFPVDLLPERLAQFVRAVATATQTPNDLAGMLVFAAASTLAAREVRISPWAGWFESVIIWAVVGMPPGSGKTPVFTLVIAPVEEFERELQQSARPELARYEATAALAAHAVEDAAKRAKERPKDQRAQDAYHAAIDARDSLAPVYRPRLLAEDATPESVAALLAQHGKIALLSDEGGPLALIGRYSDSRGMSKLEVYLKGHTGTQSYRVDRRNGDPVICERPAVTLGLAVQPEVLRSLGEKPEYRGRGLTARPLYALPESLVGKRLPDAPPVPDAVSEDYGQLMRELGNAMMSGGTFGDKQPHTLYLSEKAAELFRGFRRDLEPRLAESTGDLAEAGLTEWASKLPGQLLRVAALLHLLDDPAGNLDQEVPADTMQRALDFAEYLIAHTRAVFDDMDADERVQGAEYLLSRVRAHLARNPGTQEITRREMRRAAHGRFKLAADLEMPINVLLDHGWLRPVREDEQQRQSGRPSPRYLAHPSLCVTSDAEAGATGGAKT